MTAALYVRLRIQVVISNALVAMKFNYITQPIIVSIPEKYKPKSVPCKIVNILKSLYLRRVLLAEPKTIF